MSMSDGNSPSSPNVSRVSRPAFANLAAFVFGLPVGIGVLAVILNGPYQDAELVRYIHHPVEQVEVVLFCCALGALLGKSLGQWRERAAFHRELLPAWDGVPVPVADAEKLLSPQPRPWGGLRNTCLHRRVTAILDFVRNRGSAHGLDDQMRALADNDALALESSYSLLRLIIWAIPILGFLGTVLGITGAISGVSPE